MQIRWKKQTVNLFVFLLTSLEKSLIWVEFWEDVNRAAMTNIWSCWLLLIELKEKETRGEKGNGGTRPQAMLEWIRVTNLWHKLIGSEGCQNDMMFDQSGSYKEIWLWQWHRGTFNPAAPNTDTITAVTKHLTVTVQPGQWYDFPCSGSVLQCTGLWGSKDYEV